MKGDSTQYVESLHQGGPIPDRGEEATTPTDELHDSIKVAINILSNSEGVEVASPFWANATKVLENEIKRMLQLKSQRRYNYRG